jgi:S1-C subfamily serine protease
VRRAALVALPAAAAVVAGAAIALPTGSDPGPASPASAPRAIPLRISSGNGIATGFAVGPNRVVTVAHVIEGPVKVRSHRVRVLAVDRRSDLALLALPGMHAAGANLTSTANGQHLRLLRLRDGRPSALSVRVRRSIVAHLQAPGTARALRRPALELAARVAPGDSGAPVVTESGAVAGVVFAASRNEDTAYAVDASALRRLLRSP